MNRDSSPKAFGESLRRLREEAGRTVEDISGETKISKSVLTALESGGFQFLPEKVFSRNFVRQYATVIGADPDQLADGFDQAWERHQLASGSHVVIDRVPPPRPSIRWRFWVPIGAGIVLLLLVLVAVVTGRSGPEVLIQDRGLPAVEPTSFPTAAVPSPRPTVPGLAAEAVDILLRVEPGEECWVHYRDGEGQTAQQLLAGEEELRLKLTGPVKLTIGNAGGVTVNVGGEVYRELGRSGEVIHATATRDGLVRLGGPVEGRGG